MCRLFETIRIENGRPMNLEWHEERMIRSGLMMDAGCRMQDAGCEMQDARCGMQDAGCGMRDAGCGMQDAGCRMRDAGCGMQDAGCRMRDAGQVSPGTWQVSRDWLDELISVPENMKEGIGKCNIIYDKEIIEIKFELYVKRPVRSLKLVHASGLDYHLKYCDRSVLETLLAKRGDCDDVIIVNDGLITDTSFSNLVFFDGESWFTPARPLLEGTCRARLLSEKKIILADIRPSDLTRYQGCKLINAMREPEGEEIIRNEGMKE